MVSNETETLRADRDQWRTNYEQLSKRNLEMAERHSEHLHRAIERAKAAEAKVARVEALADELWGDPTKPHDGHDAVQTIYRHIVAQIRAALDAE